MSDNYAWTPQGEFEYRPMVRRKYLRDNDKWTEWERLGNRLSYGTIGAANMIKGRDQNNELDYERRWGKLRDSEYRIERRPVDQWEVVE